MGNDTYEDNTSFDTDSVIEELVAADFGEDQAAALAQALTVVFEQVIAYTIAMRDQLECEDGDLKEMIHEAREDMLGQQIKLGEALRLQAFSIIAAVMSIAMIFRLFA